MASTAETHSFATVSLSGQPTLDNTWGAALIGLIFASILYGITTLQLYIYFTTYPKDSKRYKCLATVAWLLDTGSLGLVANGMYGYLVSDMFQPLARLRVNRSLDLDPVLMGFLAFLTHWYLGMRVWTVCNKNVWLGGVLAAMSCTALGLAIASSVVSFQFTYWTEKHAVRSLALAGTALVVALDVLIASILCVFLIKQNATGKETKRIVRKVIIFAINTGLASSVLSIVNVVTFVALPDTMIFLGTNFIFTKIYANCLLANLNARESLRGRGYVDDGALSLNLSAFRADEYGVGVITYRDTATQRGAHVSPTAINLDIQPETDSVKERLRPDSPV